MTKLNIKQKKSGFAVYYGNTRQTGFVPDLPSANIVLKHFKGMPKTYLKK